MVSEVHLAVLFLLCHCHPLAQNIVCYMRIHAMLALGLDFDIPCLLYYSIAIARIVLDQPEGSV